MADEKKKEIEKKAYTRFSSFGDYFIQTSEKIKYTSVTFDANHHADYAVVYDELRNVIQVHFEKTNGGWDWIDNLDFPKQLYDTFDWDDGNGPLPIKLYVHEGWGNMFKALKHDMHTEFEELRRAHPDAEVEVIGWSLGSGLAQLAVQDLNYKFGVKAHCYTFGSVKPFWYCDKTTENYLKSTYKEMWNFYHRSDIVAYQPPFPGYHMLDAKPFGSYNPIGIFNPWKYHTLYGEPKWYEGTFPATNSF